MLTLSPPRALGQLSLSTRGYKYFFFRRTSHSVATERVGVSIHNPVGDTYFTILLRTHPGRWGKSSSSQSIGTSRPGSHSGEATSDSNAQAGGSSLRLSTGGAHREIHLILNFV